MFALGKAAQFFVNAVISMEESDIDAAIASLQGTALSTVSLFISSFFALTLPDAAIAIQRRIAPAAGIFVPFEMLRFHLVLGTLASLGKWWSGTPKKIKSSAEVIILFLYRIMPYSKRKSLQVHLDVMVAECKLQSAVLELLHEGLMSKLGAGWEFHKAWQAYNRISKEYSSSNHSLLLTPY